MSKEILITTTFREFDGQDNHKIQIEFLKALEKQSYKNFRLVVTNFREKNVHKTLKSFNLKFDFVQSDLDHYCSFTEVVDNGIKRLNSGKHILLWTNSDMIMPENFLQSIIDEYEPGFSGTCFPQRIFTNLEDFKNNTPIWSPDSTGVNYREKFHWHADGLDDFFNIDPNHWLPDVVFIDGDNFLDPKTKTLFLEHRLDGSWPGICQNLMFGFLNNNAPRKNIVFKTQINEILNNYANKPSPSVQDLIDAKVKQFEGCEASFDIIESFCEAQNYPQRLRHKNNYLVKLNQVTEYDIIGSVAEKQAFKNYLAFWKLRYDKLKPEMEIHNLNHRCFVSESNYAKLVNSKSWKLTAPLRKAIRLIKRIRRKFLSITQKPKNTPISDLSTAPLKQELESHPPHFLNLPSYIPNLNERELIWTIQRGLRSPLWRNRVASNVAQLISSKYNLNQSFGFEDVKENVKELNLNGFTRLPNLLNEVQINDILNYLQQKSIIDFYNDNQVFKLNDIPENAMMGRYTPKDVMNAPHILKALNHPKVLKIAEDFLGAPPTISVSLIMVSLDNKVPAKEMQLFHRDSDDFKFCKSFIYLTDVEHKDNGPHLYIKNSVDFNTIKNYLIQRNLYKSDKDVWKLYEMRRFSAEEITKSFPEENFEYMYGKKGTSFMADTYGIHRGLPAKKGHRILLQAQYSLVPTPLFNYRPNKADMPNSDEYTRYVNRLYFG